MYKIFPKIRLLINLLLSLEVCLGTGIIVVTAYFQRVLVTFLTETENKILSANFFNVYILGFQLIASYLCSLLMWNLIWPRRYSENIELLLNIWLIFCSLIVICGSFTIWTLLRGGGALAEGAEIILLKGIDIYYMNPEWKFLWDELQFTRECCGVNSYRDWMQASWMSENFKTTKLRFKRNAYNANSPEQDVMFYDITEPEPIYLDPQTVETREQTLAPYACCKHASVSCYVNYIPQVEMDNMIIPHLNLTDINTNGCLPQFTKYLATFMSIIFILILIAVLINIIICCLTKYIMALNYKRGYREFHNDFSMFDDEGNALVVIKCPPKVKCITLEEPNTYSGSDIPNMISCADYCPCQIRETINSNAKSNVSKSAQHNLNNKNPYIFH